MSNFVAAGEGGVASGDVGAHEFEVAALECWCCRQYYRHERLSGVLLEELFRDADDCVAGRLTRAVGD